MFNHTHRIFIVISVAAVEDAAAEYNFLLLWSFCTAQIDLINTVNKQNVRKNDT